MEAKNMNVLMIDDNMSVLGALASTLPQPGMVVKRYSNSGKPVRMDELVTALNCMAGLPLTVTDPSETFDQDDH